jgi:hypothetical protein
LVAGVRGFWFDTYFVGDNILVLSKQNQAGLKLSCLINATVFVMLRAIAYSTN